MRERFEASPPEGRENVDPSCDLPGTQYDDAADLGLRLTVYKKLRVGTNEKITPREGGKKRGGGLVLATSCFDVKAKCYSTESTR